MKKFLMGMIKDGSNNISSMRITLILTIVFFFGNWIFALATSGAFAPSWELVVFVIFIVTGKVIQKFGEQ